MIKPLMQDTVVTQSSRDRSKKGGERARGRVGSCRSGGGQ